MGEWNMAYLYSKFAKINFHGKNSCPQRLLFVDETLYHWKFLEAHCASCFYTGRKEEGRVAFNEILALTKSNPEYFTPEDLNKININSQFFL